MSRSLTPKKEERSAATSAIRSLRVVDRAQHRERLVDLLAVEERLAALDGEAQRAASSASSRARRA